MTKYESKLYFQDEYAHGTKHIETLLLIFDNDTSDMTLDEKGLGKVNFISNNELKDITNSGEYTDELFLAKKIKKIDMVSRLKGNE